MYKNNTSWEAVYEDGNSLLQFNEDGTENRYVDIKREKITQFVLYRDKNPAVVVHLDANKRLIYRMRRAQDNHGNEEAVFLAGWQEKRNGMNVQMVSVLFEDNRVEIIDRFYENHLWFYKINFIPDERL